MNEGQMLHQTESVLDEFESFIKGTPWYNQCHFTIEMLRNELTSPCVLAIAGKVKAGKSSLLNALLGVDLAMIGTTETTATINVFKSGMPISLDKPVLCQYLDGSQVWREKSYLDNLQGTSETALQETSRIDKLVFYIPDNAILNTITIVDTPGIGAEVGSEGDSHQLHTDAYFNLRERHKQETTALSNSADAVIYLFDTVPTELDKEFLDALYHGGKGLTALNGVGVLSKIDKDFSQIENVSKFKQEFEHQLFTIVPTSSAIYHYIPSIDQASVIKKQLHDGFLTEQAFKNAVLSQIAFLHPSLPKCTLTVEERKNMVSSFEDENFQWSTFRRIAEKLYYCDDVEKAICELIELSGIDRLKNFISEHFFKRAKLLRCHRVLSDVKLHLTSILYSKKYIDNEERASLKSECLASCDSMKVPIRDILKQLVNDYVPTVDDIKRLNNSILALKARIEQIQSELDTLNNSFVIYQKILSESDQFSTSEISELEALLSGKESQANFYNKLKYWNAVYNTSKPNSIRQYAASVAKNIYQELLLKYER